MDRRSGLLRCTQKTKTTDTYWDRTQAENVYPVCIPYVTGVLENFQCVFWEHSVASYDKPFKTPVGKTQAQDPSGETV